MRHNVSKYLKFKGKDQQHIRAMQRNLVTSLFVHKKIKTTEKKAKSIIPMVDRLINVVNTKEEREAIRYVMKYVFTKNASLELFNNVAPKYKGEKTSGFTRITPIKYRDWDSAKVVMIELI